MRSPENEAVALAMWGENHDRDGLAGILRWATDDGDVVVVRVRDGKICWTGSSPDLGALLGLVGLGDRRFANEALVGLH